jgi:hypothetical protein
MKYTYNCPSCKAILNPNIKIVLSAVCGKQRGLMLFSPKPGDYTAIYKEDLKFKKGDTVDFRCPVCGVSLTSEVDRNLAEILFHTDTGTEGKVDFSRKVGQKATYFVTRETIRSYGEHAELYGDFNFFGASKNTE